MLTLSDGTKIGPAEWTALEALFAQDLPDGRPARIRRRLADNLIAKGFAIWREEVICRDRFGTVKANVLRISLRGHAIYCMNCPEPEPNQRIAEGRM